MISLDHPYWHVRGLVESRDDIVWIPISYYKYRPRSIEDERYVREIHVVDFLDPHFMEGVFLETPPGFELALNSDFIMVDGQICHLTMIDMATAAQAHLDKLQSLIGDYLNQKIYWYESGRSFHGYGTRFLSPKEWYEFMGLLLLVNQPHHGPIVDPRWIGHRLISGYASLRWTRNTNYYIKSPSELKRVMGAYRTLF